MRKLSLIMCLFLGQTILFCSAQGNVQTKGGTFPGHDVGAQYWFQQDKFASYANDIHFTVDATYPYNAVIYGWSIYLWGFNQASSQQLNSKSVEVSASDGYFGYGQKVKINRGIWSNCIPGQGSFGLYNVNWSQGPIWVKAAPDMYFLLTPFRSSGGKHLSNVIFYNADATDGFELKDIKLVGTYEDYDLTTLDSTGSGLFDSPDTTFENVYLNPGDSVIFTLVRDTDLFGGHIYGIFTINTDEVIVIFDHPVESVRAPSLSALGFIILAIVLTLSAGYILYRRRQTT